MKTTNIYPVTPNRIDRFAKINEAMRQLTVHAEARSYLCFKDLSLMHIHVIRLIHSHKFCTMSQLATMTDLTMGSITQLIDKLIDKKYVKRIHCKKDRRVVYAQLTAKGQKIIVATRQYITSIAENILSKLNEDDQEAFLNLFNKMISE